MERLNPEQENALRIITKPLLVIAGAGTGKTRLITEKIKFLHSTFDIPADRILAITFTNKAAKEMKERVESDNKKFPYILTFHSFALKILKNYCTEAGINPNFTIYDELDQLKIIKEILKETKSDSLNPKKIKDQISLYKERGTPIPADLKKVYSLYKETLEFSNALDFDDIILKVNKVFKEYPEISDLWRDSFDYILVDEFQDTNKPQLQLIKNLYNKNFGNITVVGDPNQSIYSWRGAEISNILEFEKHFNNVEIIKLNQNYRSTPEIITIANNLVKGKIPEKFIPELISNKDSGKNPLVRIFKSDTEEAKKISNAILHLLSKNKYNFKDIAILIRNNHLSSEIEKEFIRQKIPYKIFGKHALTERSEIKLILSYIRTALNPKDELSFKYCINTPSRGFGKKTLELLKENYKENWIETLKEKKDEMKNSQQENIKDFLLLMEKIKYLIEENNKKEIIKTIKSSINIENYLLKKYKNNSVVGKKLKNIELLQEMLNDTELSIKEFIENLYLQSSQDEMNNEDFITIITIHSAKGLEFPVVFIPGLENGIIPNTKSDIEEERRTLYTAITRAKDLLFISSTDYRKGHDGKMKKTSQSPFLKDIANGIKKITQHQQLISN